MWSKNRRVFYTRAMVFGLAFAMVIPSTTVLLMDSGIINSRSQIIDDDNISSKPGDVVMNAEATQVVQSGFGGGTPIWDMGIRGEGQIVGLYDLGVDYDHEAFRNSTTVADNAPGPTHRKMYAYHVMPGADDSDSGSFDHGTLNACMMVGDNSVVIGSNSGNTNGGKKFEIIASCLKNGLFRSVLALNCTPPTGLPVLF